MEKEQRDPEASEESARSEGDEEASSDSGVETAESQVGTIQPGDEPGEGGEEFAGLGGDESPAPPDTKPHRRHRLLYAFLKFLFLTPVYLVYSLLAFGAGIGWHYFDESGVLDIDEVAKLEVGALVLDANGLVIGRAGSMNRQLIKREDIPAHFVDALIAAEDQRFFFHPGFDPAGAMRAAWANYRAEAIREGASTLTQQLARDVFQLQGKDADRKLLEIAAAVRIEGRYTKDEILVFYLNRIYFGSGFYGLGSAAQGYFGKRVSELTVDESALLCGLIPSPSRNSPFVSESRAREYRNQTLRRMRLIGKLPYEELEELLTAETRLASDREALLDRGQVRYLLTRVEREFRAEWEKVGKGAVIFDGLTIETSIDLAMQQAAAKEIDHHLAAMRDKNPAGEGAAGPDGLEGAFVLIENRTGQVVVSVGSRDYQRSEYDRAIEMKRPPGSALFPFVYAAAFEGGQFGPNTPVLDAPFDNREMGLGSIAGVLGEWSTENPDNRWEGHITAADALRYSKNSPTARLGLRTGLEPLRNLMKAAGIQSELREMPASILGASELTLTELTRAYIVFPNSGLTAPEPEMIVRVREGDGDIVAHAEARAATRAMSASTARAVADLLSDRRGTAGSGGKAGTTPGFTDVWYFGFDEEHTWGIWIGRDTFSPIGPLAFGGVLARPVAEAIMEARVPKVPRKDRKGHVVPIVASEAQ